MESIIILLCRENLRLKKINYFFYIDKIWGYVIVFKNIFKFTMHDFPTFV